MLCPRAPAVRNLGGTCPRQLYGAGAYGCGLQSVSSSGIVVLELILVSVFI